MSSEFTTDSLRDFRRRWRRDTFRRRLADAAVFVPIAAAAGHAWGGWAGAAAAGGAMVALLVVSAVATHAALMGSYAGPALRPPPRWTVAAAWVGSWPAVAGLAACGYLAVGWGGAVGLGAASAVAFALATAADQGLRRDARAATAAGSGN
ncbi:MAG TPA: hypothetical protein VD866_30140 [Urbifossiella sp.]|nr:hypothetical protein [Urbifossiella sp.]